MRQGRISYQKAAEAMLPHEETALPHAEAMLLGPKRITIKRQKHNFSKLKA